jgi:hypothetical protein
MMQNEILTQKLEDAGTDIGPELGSKMVKDFQDAYPNEIPWNFCGKLLLQKVLDQPDCQGIRFYHALDEIGRKTLVSVGINSNGEIISEYSVINDNGSIVRKQGVVAERYIKPGGTKSTTTTTVSEWWSF